MKKQKPEKTAKRPKNLSKLRIGTKLVLKSLIIIWAVLAVAFAVIIMRTESTARGAAEQTVSALAEKNAAAVEAQLEVPLDMARALAQSMSGFEELAPESRRAFYTNILKGVLQNNTDILGVWTCWEPNALDGMDAKYANTVESDATGRFIPYWVWAYGKPSFLSLVDYDKPGAGDYYLLAKNSGEETILDPYIYAINGKDVLLTSVVVPIKNKAGQVAGVAGIDLTLEALQKIQFDKGSYQSAYITLLSNTGVNVIHPKAEQIGKALEGDAGLLKAAKEGKKYQTDTLSAMNNQQAKSVYVPIHIGNTKTPWSTGITLEMSEINAPVAQMTQIMIIIVIALVVLVSAGLIIIVWRSVSKPVKATADFAKALAGGNLDQAVKIKSLDEIGQLTAILDKDVRDAFKSIESARAVSEKQAAYQAAEVEKLVVNLEKISRGDLDCRLIVAAPDEDTQNLYEIYAGINQSFEACIQAIRALAGDADMLAQAAVEGRLSTRADASLHQGDFKKIVEGVNNTLDALIQPIDEAVAVMKELQKGNLSANVAGDFKGDHAIIKDTLNDTINTIRGYIDEISDVLGKIAKGDLTAGIEAEYRGDFTGLKDSINTIVQALNTVLLDIHLSAEQVAAGAGQVSAGNQTISQGATEQAGSIEELTATITQIASQIRQNAINANEASKISLAARQGAADGSVQMDSMQKAMADIRESSQSISKIIKVIDDIAFQTNILALNAAVEAARAGIHGKGFAVVAEEVRNLAAKSAKAAKETTVLIEDSIGKSEAGTRIAGETAETLQRIVSGVEATVKLVEEITVASNEQATGISQVNKGIEQLSQVVQNNSATAQEGAAASEELSSQAELLNDKVAQFKLK